MPKAPRNQNAHNNDKSYSKEAPTKSNESIPPTCGIFKSMLNSNYVLAFLIVKSDESFIIVNIFNIELRMPTLEDIYNIADTTSKTRSPNGFIIFRKVISNYFSLRETAKKLKSVGIVSAHAQLMWKYSSDELRDAFQNLAKQYQKEFNSNVVVYKPYKYPESPGNKGEKINDAVDETEAVEDVAAEDVADEAESSAGANDVELLVDIHNINNPNHSISLSQYGVDCLSLLEDQQPYYNNNNTHSVPSSQYCQITYDVLNQQNQQCINMLYNTSYNSIQEDHTLITTTTNTPLDYIDIPHINPPRGALQIHRHDAVYDYDQYNFVEIPSGKPYHDFTNYINNNYGGNLNNWSG
ncbi:10073_t:CDS:2 [Entrophospora sp. SA101]|nr:10073_t:CDS:2 [Entrophospora sp. SA101]